MAPSSPDSAPAVAGESLSALLIDFGGVLTTPISDAFGALSEEAGLAHGTALSLLAGHEGARTALREHEEGRLDDEGFEDAFAQAIVESGGRLAARGLLARIGARMQLDEPMVELVREVRRRGVPVALVSNSLGRNCYAKVDLDELFELAGDRVRITGILVEPDRAGMEALAGLVEASELRVHVSQTFPLADAARAHVLGETGRVQGKLVLTVS